MVTAIIRPATAGVDGGNSNSHSEPQEASGCAAPTVLSLDSTRKAIRDYLHRHAGDTLDFLVQESGDVLMRPAVEDVRSRKRALHRPGRKPVPLDALRRAIRQRGGSLS
jgi:hypothetical protein